MKNLILGLSLLIYSANSFSGKERDGGNPQGLSVAYITKYIESGLKDDLIILLNEINIRDIKNDYVKRVVLDLFKNDFSNDVSISPYILAKNTKAKKCIDSYGNARGATSGRGDLYGSICFDTVKLKNLTTTKSSLIALAVHEHAHHIGYEDKDNAIGKYFTAYIDFLENKSFDHRSINDKDQYIIEGKEVKLPSSSEQKRIIFSELGLSHLQATSASGADERLMTLLDANIIEFFNKDSKFSVAKAKLSCSSTEIEICHDSLENILNLNSLILNVEIECHFSGFFSSDRCELELKYIDRQFLSKKDKWVVY